MKSQVMPAWLVFSERAFAFNFTAFSFVMFSCWFPTGFSATFSTLACLFALPIAWHKISSVELNHFEVSGLVLFSWLLLSLCWSDVAPSVGLEALSEYRIYIMLPILTLGLTSSPKTQQSAFTAAMLGAFIALVTSYGLGLGWWQIEGAKLSLANRIYHGFIMSSFLLGCLLVAREARGVIRLIAATVALLVIYNVLNIETGRTGYLQVLLVCIVFPALALERTKAVMVITSLMVVFGASYALLDRFSDRVNETVANVEMMVMSDDYHSSAGYRLEFYRAALDVGLDYPLRGVGVGDVAKTLQERAESGEIRVLTDNVHSEFMNMLVAGGLPAFLLFSGFIISIAYSGLAVRKSSSCLGDALIGVAVISFASALFNSTIKDYGEKHALLIMLALLSARLLAKKKLPNTAGSKAASGF